MGFLIFLVILVLAVIIIGIALSIGGLIFGGEDPYERELTRMDYEDEVRQRLDDIEYRLDEREFDDEDNLY